MRNTKRRIEPLSLYDHTGIERHLEKMALKGWMIERITNYGWIYRRIEPKKLHFCVSYYPKASAFDPEPTEGQQTFFDFCAHTGWILACTSAQMQVFYNEREDPIPIETDPVIEVENIHSMCKRSFLPAQAVNLLTGLFCAFLYAPSALYDPIEFLSSPTKLFLEACWIILVVTSATEIIAYFHWYRKALQAAEQGEFMNTFSTTNLQKTVLAILFLMLFYLVVNALFATDAMMRFIMTAMMIYMVSLFLLVDTIRRFLKRKKAPRNVNRTVTLILSFGLSFTMMGLITLTTLKLSSEGFFADGQETYEYHGQTWVVYNDQIPLRIEDMLDVEYDGYMTENRMDSTIFLAKQESYQRPRFDAEDYKDMPTLHYTLVTVKLPFLYDICKKQMYDDLDETDSTSIPEGHQDYLEETDAAPWGAKAAYYVKNQSQDWESRHYLLCYTDTIVEIQFDWDVTEEHKAIVGELFG